MYVKLCAHGKSTRHSTMGIFKHRKSMPHAQYQRLPCEAHLCGLRSIHFGWHGVREPLLWLVPPACAKGSVRKLIEGLLGLKSWSKGQCEENKGLACGIFPSSLTSIHLCSGWGAREQGQGVQSHGPVLKCWGNLTTFLPMYHWAFMRTQESEYLLLSVAVHHCLCYFCFVCWQH